MVDEETNEEQQEEGSGEKQKGGRKKLLIIGGAVIALVLAVGVPVFILSFGGEKEGIEEAEHDLAAQKEQVVPEGHDDEDEYDENEESLGALFPMNTFVVNLAGEKEYVRCQLQIEFNTRDVPRRFYTRLVPIRDSLIELLTTRTAKELGAPKGREELKEDVRETINEILKREEVKTVYFTQFVVQ